MHTFVCVGWNKPFPNPSPVWLKVNFKKENLSQFHKERSGLIFIKVLQSTFRIWNPSLSISVLLTAKCSSHFWATQSKYVINHKSKKAISQWSVIWKLRAFVSLLYFSSYTNHKNREKSRWSVFGWDHQPRHKSTCSRFKLSIVSSHYYIITWVFSCHCYMGRTTPTLGLSDTPVKFHDCILLFPWQKYSKPPLCLFPIEVVTMDTFCHDDTHTERLTLSAVLSKKLAKIKMIRKPNWSSEESLLLKEQDCYDSNKVGYIMQEQYVRQKNINSKVSSLSSDLLSQCSAVW